MIRTRPQLVRSLLASRDARAALAKARAARELCDYQASLLLEPVFNRLVRGRLSRAGPVVRAAEALAAAGGALPQRAIALRMAGVLDHLEGRPVRASRRLARAGSAYKNAGLFVEAGDLQRILVDVLMHLGEYAAAGRAVRKARALYRRAGGADPRRMGSLAMNEGNIHHRRDRYAEALRAYGTARRHFARSGEARRLANVDFNRANVLASLDRTAEARTLFESARAAFRDGDLPALEAQVDSALGGLDLLENRPDRSIARLESVRARQSALHDRIGAAHSDLDAAEAYLRLNRPVDAERAARNALEFFRRARHDAEQATCLGILAGVALRQAHPRRAVSLFTRSRQLQRGAGNRVAAAMTEVGLAQAQVRGLRPADALRTVQAAVGALRRARLPLREARALAVGAHAALFAGREALAREWASRAAVLAGKRSDPRAGMAALLVLGALEERAGRIDAAFRHFVAAERCVERLRRGVTAEESRLAFAVDKIEVYESLVSNRLRKGGKRAVRQALLYAERGKARALAERMAHESFPATAGGAAGRRLRGRLEVIERQLSVAETRLDDAHGPTSVRGVRTARFEGLTTARMSALRRLRREDPAGAHLLGARPPDPWKVIEMLGVDDVVLEYTESEGYFHLFVIEKGSVDARPRIATVKDVQEVLALLRFHLGKGVLGEDHAQRFGSYIADTMRTHFEKLHDLLIGPVATRLDGRSVRIIPHGVLHGLPFHALEQRGTALVDRCAIAYAPSLAVLGLLRRRGATVDAPALVFGVPDRAAPAIEAEVEAVRRVLVGARVFRGAAATVDAVRSWQPRPSVLHVACHGVYSAEGASSGGLRLGDAWLSLADVYSFRNTADLVVLSGCETGCGTVHSGDEWVGLVRGFLQAGARSVVASLWAVHDQSAVELMKSFYGSLADGLGVAEAMAVAQRIARRENPLALRWAPFLVVGDPSLTVRSRKAA